MQDFYEDVSFGREDKGRRVVFDEETHVSIINHAIDND